MAEKIKFQMPLETDDEVEETQVPEAEKQPDPEIEKQPEQDLQPEPSSVEFYDMPDHPGAVRTDYAPFNGVNVELTPDGEEVIVANWRVSRQWIYPSWVPQGRFYRRDRVSSPIDFEPLGWRPLTE